MRIIIYLCFSRLSFLNINISLHESLQRKLQAFCNNIWRLVSRAGVNETPLPARRQPIEDRIYEGQGLMDGMTMQHVDLSE
jgi:hypothetical protein